MADIKFSLGATVDVASSAEMNEAFKHLQGHIDRTRYRGDIRPLRKPFTVSSAMAGIPFGGSTVCIISQETKTPAVGRFWIMRSAFAYDALAPLTAGSASVLIGLAVGDPANPSPAQLRAWQFTGLPAATTFGTTALHVYPNETPYLVYGAATLPTGSDISFNFEVDEYPVDAEAMRL